MVFTENESHHAGTLHELPTPTDPYDVLFFPNAGLGLAPIYPWPQSLASLVSKKWARRGTVALVSDFNPAALVLAERVWLDATAGQGWRRLTASQSHLLRHVGQNLRPPPVEVVERKTPPNPNPKPKPKSRSPSSLEGDRWAYPNPTTLTPSPAHIFYNPFRSPMSVRGSDNLLPSYANAVFFACRLQPSSPDASAIRI